MSSTMSTDPASGLGIATHVSGQGSVTLDPGGSAVAAPGAGGPLSNMSVAHAALLVIVGAAAGLVALGVIFRRPIGATK